MKTKEQKRIEAAERQEAHNALTKKQKIAKAKSRRGESKKELARIG